SKVDLAGYRGKLVLVDHWVTTCSACIHAMARLHDVYLRYKEQGFEVLSVCYDGKAQREKGLRIEKEMGLTWITVAADGMWDAMSHRYGYQGVPQYMLLNRDGTLHAGTAEVDMGRGLQPLLDEMLVAEAAAKKM